MTRFAVLALAVVAGCGGEPCLEGSEARDLTTCGPPSRSLCGFAACSGLRNWCGSGENDVRRCLSCRTLESDGGSASPAWVWDIRYCSTPLPDPPVQPTATLLPSGHVVLVGVPGPAGGSPSVEVYDPMARTFTPAGSTGPGRVGHTATLLPSGAVLLVGGAPPQLYDPGTGTFAATGPLVAPRQWHTATLLASGKVLLAGGRESRWEYGPFLTSAELYDPQTGSFSPVADSLATVRATHTGTLLASGKVLIAGGHDEEARPVWPAELYDPETATFAPVEATTGSGTFHSLQSFHSATLLPSGQVLLVAADSGDAVRYDPEAGSFTPTAPMTAQYEYVAAALLHSGQVLVTGGMQPSSGAERYDPQTDSFTPTAGSTDVARRLHTATTLPSGAVLLVGVDRTAELYDPATDGFTTLAMP